MATEMDGTRRAFLPRLRGYWPLALVALLVLAALALFLATRFRAPPEGATASSSNTSPVQAIEWQDLMTALIRYGVRPEGEQPDIDVLLATPAYFSVSGRTPPSEARGQPSLLFYVTEEAHDELPRALPRPLLRVGDAPLREPASTTAVVDSEHHRTTAVRYSAVDSRNEPLVTGDTARLVLVFPAPDGREVATANVLSWELPLNYAEGLMTSEVTLGLPGSTLAGGAGVASSPASRPFGLQSFTWAAILAIMAGMLIALSPCLVQLAVYYTATLAGASAEGSNPGTVAAARKHVLLTGLFFTLGFTLLYTSGGAAAGFVGQSLESMGVLGRWTRPIMVVAGAVIIVMALRVAWNARAPLVCRLPMAPLFGRKHRTGLLGSAVMGVSFAGGCLACFAATVLPALLFYAGASGSMAFGALLLLVFSLGITVPCMALAVGVSRAQPLMSRLQRAGPALGLLSAAVMVGFGILMITNQFHIVSGFIRRFLPL